MSTRILCIAVAACLTVILKMPAQAQEQKLSLAIISGEGPREPNPDNIALLEVALSRRPGLALVERSQIQDILRELSLSAGGFFDPSQSPRLGHILGAQILIFVEKMPSPNGPIDRYRLVESKTGIVINTLFEDEKVANDITLIVQTIGQGLQKLLVPPNQRYYIGVLDVRNTEPGIALDGKAEALKMFLANDMALSPNIFVLDREHLQHLQEEKTLSNNDLDLKASTYLIEGGIRHSYEGQTLLVQLFLHKMDGTGAQQIDVQVPSDDILTTRYILRQRILELLNAKAVEKIPDNKQMESVMFLKQVAPLILSGKYEDAVRSAEVAYALQPGRETTFWASRAWYSLGQDLLQQMNKSVDTHSLVLQERMQRASYIQRDFLPILTNMEFWHKTNPQDQGTPTQNKQTAGQTLNLNVKEQWKNTVGEIKVPYDKKERLIKVLLRAVQLAQEFTDRYVRDFTTGQIFEVPMPDPLASLQDEDPLWALHFPQCEDEPRIHEIQDNLITAETSLLAAQRKFYLGLSDKNAYAVVSYWKTWQHEGHTILNLSHGSSLDFYQNLVGAFQENPSNFPTEKIIGFWDAIRLPPDMPLPPATISFFKDLSLNSDPFLKMTAGRMLMRVDPKAYAGEILKAYIELQKNTKTTSTELSAFFADFLALPVNYLAVYDKDTLLSLAGDIIRPVLKSNNARRLTAWRSVLWPYINALSQSNDKTLALGLIAQCQEILNAVSIKDASNPMNRLRAELDLKLVWLGAKNEADPSFHHFFDDPMVPSYLRQRAEIEPPRPDGPLDLFGFPNLDLVYGKKYQSTISRRSETWSMTGGGKTFEQTIDRDVDAEGNEFFSIHTIKAQLPHADNRLIWAGYEVKKMDFRMNGSADTHLLIDGDSLYEIIPYRTAKATNLKAYRYSLSSPRVKNFIGTAHAPTIEDGTAITIASMTIGENQLFVGTTAGIFIFPASASLPINDAPYVPYSNMTSLAPPIPVPTNEEGQIIRLDEEKGLPDNRVLSLAYLNKKLYIAIGPTEGASTSLHGVSGLLSYDLESKTYKILASSRSLNGRGPLEAEGPYQINAILPDMPRNCLWMAVGGNQSLNGIWRYDLGTEMITQVIKEDLSVLDMQWSSHKILYTLFQSGWSMFDPDSKIKTWMMGYTISPWTGDNPPLAPRGIQDQPLYGFPKTRLRPFAVDENENIITVGWDAYELLQHGKKSTSEPLKKMDPLVDYVNEITYVARNLQGVWVVTGNGQVFCLTPVIGPPEDPPSAAHS